MTAALKVRALEVGYESQPVLSNLNLEINAGEIVAISGPSGVGKSTLLLTILGALPELSGEISVAGKLVNGLPIRERQVGIVFQEALLFPHLSVEENIAYGLRDQSKEVRDSRVAELMALIGLGEIGNTVQELSGGQKQRVALARALAPKPTVLLLDEPLSAVDEAKSEELLKQLKQYFREWGTAVLYVTHDLDQARKFADRVIPVESLTTTL